MAKRQRRISGEEIFQKIKNIPVQPVSVVLKNGKVYFVRVLEILELSIQYEDMKQFKNEMDIKDIDEVIIDI